MSSRLRKRLPTTPAPGQLAAAVLGLGLASVVAVAATRVPRTMQTAEPQRTPLTDSFYASPTSTSTNGATRRCGTATCTAGSRAPRRASRSTSRPRSNTRAASSSTSRRCRTTRTSPRRSRPASYDKIGFVDRRAAPTSWKPTAAAISTSARRPAAQTDPTITAYRANAAAAQYSRTVAMQMYGGKRPYGYAYGGSGGAYRTIGSIREHAAACGTASSRTSSARRWRSRTCSPCGCRPCGSCRTSSRRSSTRSSQAAAAIPTRG